MTDNKKEQGRSKLHRMIWEITNDLRGKVDGWDFKQHVLGLLFYSYISEKLTNYINEGEPEAGDAGFDYAALVDSDAEQTREALLKSKGFFVLPSQLFKNICKKETGDKNLNKAMEKAFKSIEDLANDSEKEAAFKGLFADMDANSSKLGNSVAARNKKRAKLMGMYVSSVAKSGGEYYTPQEVSELLTRITVVGKNEESRNIVAHGQVLRNEIDKIIAEIEVAA